MQGVAACNHQSIVIRRIKRPYIVLRVFFCRIFRKNKICLKRSEFILFRNTQRKIAELYSALTFCFFFVKEKEMQVTH